MLSFLVEQFTNSLQVCLNMQNWSQLEQKWGSNWKFGSETFEYNTLLFKKARNYDRITFWSHFESFLIEQTQTNNYWEKLPTRD